MSASPWISLEEAARRSGKSVGHLRRLCGEAWLAQGVARQVGGGGKRPRWEIDERADGAFARAKFADQIGTDLRAVPAGKRQEAISRKAILDRWSEAKRGGFLLGFSEAQITAQFVQRLELDEGAKISRRTLFYWAKRHQAGGLAGLVDGRGGANAADRSDDPFLAEVRRLWLSPRKLKLSVVHEIVSLMAADRGWEARSRKTCERHLATLPKALVLRQRFGGEAYVNEAEPHLVRDYSTISANELWCGDHHQFDVICRGRDGKHVRPWLTAWQDLRSRKIVGWSVFEHAPNSDTILSTFRRAVLDHGVPTGIYVDNGKDYDCAALNGRTKAQRWEQRRVRVELPRERSEGIFPALGIAVTHCWPYHGQSKPIERFFGTVETRTPVWATYCGSSPAERPEDLEARLERGEAPTVEEFADWFGQWLSAWHATHAHRGDAMEGRTPDEVFASTLAVRRTAPAELLDLLLLRKSQPVLVRQNGVAFDGLQYGANAPELFALLGRKVCLRVDDADRSRVQVWTAEDDRFVCVAEANAKVPANASSAELRAAIAAKAAHRRQLRQYIERRPRMTEDLPELLIRGRAAAGAADSRPPQGPDDGPAIQPVRSPLEAELPNLQRAVERMPLRPAVGAETMGFAYQSNAVASDDDDATSSPFTYHREVGDE